MTFMTLSFLELFQAFNIRTNKDFKEAPNNHLKGSLGALSVKHKITLPRQLTQAFVRKSVIRCIRTCCAVTRAVGYCVRVVAFGYSRGGTV